MQRLRLPIVAFAVLVVAGALGGSIAAVAQQAPTDPTVPPTSTTAPSPFSTTTTVAPTTTTSTTAPKPFTPAKPAATTSTTANPNAPRIVPPEYVGKINSVKRSKPNNTGGVLDALAPLRDFGLSDKQIAVIGFGHFPVAGYATFIDDWWAPRFTPSFHLHQGTDIWAPIGTPVRAPADGVLKQAQEPVGGLSVYVVLPDGTQFYGAHLSALADGQKNGQRVKQGDIIGFVGNSGDADGGPAHLHFQVMVHGAPVNPKPFLDEWIKGAIQNAPALIAAFQGNRPRAVVATAMTRELADGGGGMFGAPASPPRSQLLWATAASPSAGAVHLAEAEVAAAVREAGWISLSREQAARVAEWDAADAAARGVLAPLTPRVLWGVLNLGAAPSP